MNDNPWFDMLETGIWWGFGNLFYYDEYSEESMYYDEYEEEEEEDEG